jgi:hypothetical protein
MRLDSALKKVVPDISRKEGVFISVNSGVDYSIYSSNDYVLNYEELLEKSKMPASLKVRRLRSIAIETFKIIHKESPIYLHDLVNIKKHNP